MDAHKIVMLVPILLYSVTIHEFFHAWAASRLGDDTALRQGRVSFNPLVHLDPMGTICFVLVGFGWGKPVPVMVERLRRPLRDNALVSLAGPASNLASAVVFAIVYRLGASFIGVPHPASFGYNFLAFFHTAIFVSLLLCFFNLIPLPPLDGGHVLEAALPWRARQWVRQNRMALQIGLLVFIFTVGGSYLYMIVQPIARLLLGA